MDRRVQSATAGGTKCFRTYRNIEVLPTTIYP
jgi:hypothetical protein